MHGKFYEYVVSGIFSCSALGRMGWFVGNCDRSTSSSMPTRVESLNGEGDVQAGGILRWITNGVTRLCGIRNPPEMLTKAGLAIIQDHGGGLLRPGLAHGGNVRAAISRRKPGLWAIARPKGWSQVHVQILLESFEISPHGRYPTLEVRGSSRRWNRRLG